MAARFEEGPDPLLFAASGEQVYPNIGVYKVDRGGWTMQMMSASR